LAEYGRRAVRALTLDTPLWLSRIFSALVLLFALGRGYSRRVHPYAFSQYQYTYMRGFLIRALPGEVAQWTCGHSTECLSRFVEVSGTVSVFAFTLVLWLVTQARGGRSAANLTLGAFGAGPLLVQIGAGRGYHDALTLTLGIGAYYAFLRRRWFATMLLFGVALLVHELVAVYVLPLLVLPILASLKERALLLRQGAVLLVLAACAAAVVELGHASPAQEREVASRLRASTTLGRHWKQYRSAGVAAAKIRPATLSAARFGDFRRPAMARYLVPLAGALLLVLGLLAARRQALWFPPYAVLILAPLAILLVAWDTDRLTALAGTTALFVCLAVEERTELRCAPRYVFVLALALAALGLTTRYNLAGRYAYDGTLFGPERQRPR
jgi:hypothetical protein